MLCVGVFDNGNARPHKADMMHLTAILRKIQDQTGWNQSELAAKLGVKQPTVSRWYGGSEPERAHELRIIRLAEKLKIAEPHADYFIPIVGYTGAGGEILYGEGQGPFGEAPMPPTGKTPLTVAVEVRGTSMGLLGEGSLIYYDNRQEPPTDALFGKICVVGLHDGRVLIKRLMRGKGNGLYDLYSLAAVPLLDQAVEWAAKVTFIGFV